MKTNKEEVKDNVALAHGIIAKLKMDDLTYTHISSIDEEKSGFYISPFGFQFKDVTAQNLVHFDFAGNIKQDSGWDRYNATGLSIHSTIYNAREDVGAVVHLHTKETIAVSCQKEGLLPISQHALHFYNSVSYHSYNSLILSVKEEEEMLVKDLGGNNVMFLQNHGFLTVGRTIWEAIFYAYHLQKACEVQVLLSGIKKEDLIIPPHEVCLKAQRDLLSFEKDLGKRDFESFLL